MDDYFDIHRQKVDIFNQNYRKRMHKTVKVDIPDHLFVKCPFCQEVIYYDDLSQNDYICPQCHKLSSMNARTRIAWFVDENSFEEIDASICSLNPLSFVGYEDKLAKYQETTSEKEAFVCGKATLNAIPIALGVLSSDFMMGSMGSVVGEKVTRLIEMATVEKRPLIIFSASGGARMQEGIFSLMQMAKTSAALRYHSLAKQLYISVLTHPTTGGVLASFATLGDINIAEADALVGFAGQRVIKQTIRQDLPEGFQTALFQLEHGMVDMVSNRKDLKQVISKLLAMHNYEVSS